MNLKSLVLNRLSCSELQRHFTMSFNVEVKDKCIVITELQTANANDFPIIWLCENCQCKECFDAQTSCRKIDWKLFNPHQIPVHVAFDDAGKSLNIKWDSGHQSSYDYNWLLQRSFSSNNRDQYLKTNYRPAKILWSRDEFPGASKFFDFNEIITNDCVLKSWIEALAVNGIAMIKNTPNTRNEVRKIAERVGFIKKTHYGEEWFVEAKEQSTTYAYTSVELQLHTDIPFYEYKPGVNMLHCLVQSKSQGGANTILDAFYIATKMQQEYPEYFQVLSHVQVNWSDIGHEVEGKPFHLVYRSPVICLDHDNNVIRINYNNAQRDSFFTESSDNVCLWYEAFYKFVELINKEAVEFKMTEGDLLTFDNIRLLHGRKAYTDTSTNSRCLVGSYLDWDQLYSKLRVLND